MEGILVPIALFAMVVLLVWIGTESKKNRLREQAEARRRLLDKFASGQELTEFLATQQGQAFMKSLESLPSQFPWPGPKQRIIGSIGLGIVLVVLSSACFALMYYEQGFVYPGTFMMALGVGVLIASAVSYLLHKKWGIL